MSSVQVYGNENILTAAKNRGCTCWAIFEKNQFLFKCDPQDKNGEPMTFEDSMQFLEKCLECIQNSKAQYTIRFYDDIPRGTRIKASTDYDGSLNFLTVSPEEHTERTANWQVGSTSSKILNRLEAIETKLNAQELEEVEEEDTSALGTIGNVVLGLFQQPEKLEHLIQIGRSLLTGAFPAAQGVTRMGATSAAGNTPSTAEPANDGDKMQRLEAALNILEANDPKIVDHLEKLATLSANNKAFFGMLITSLENMK